MDTLEHVCRDDGAELRAQRKRLRELRAAEVTAALIEGPATTRQLSKRCGTHEYRMEVGWYRDGGGAVCMHLDPRIMRSRWLSTDVSYVLRQLERKGLARRVIVPGAQAHLWYWPSPSMKV